MKGNKLELVRTPAGLDVTNTDRARWAESAIEAFEFQTGTDREDALADLLADLLHWADRQGVEFHSELARGWMHYCAELSEDEAGTVLPKMRQLAMGGSK